MGIGSVTIREAISRGEKMIVLPSKAIHILSWALLIVLLSLGFSWWNLLLIPSGIVVSLIYSTLATNKWRLWAYQNVGDIHQFQRTAELTGLLIRKSSASAGWFQSNEQKRQMRELLKRFSEANNFSDDVSLPDDTIIEVNTFYPETGSMIVLNNLGINVAPEGFYEWNQIENERVADVSLTKLNGRIGGYTPAGRKAFFRFECAKGRFEIPLKSLNISAWELDLLIYIYRGRYNGSRKSEDRQL